MLIRARSSGLQRSGEINASDDTWSCAAAPNSRPRFVRSSSQRGLGETPGSTRKEKAARAWRTVSRVRYVEEQERTPRRVTASSRRIERPTRNHGAPQGLKKPSDVCPTRTGKLAARRGRKATGSPSMLAGERVGERVALPAIAIRRRGEPRAVHAHVARVLSPRTVRQRPASEPALEQLRHLGELDGVAHQAGEPICRRGGSSLARGHGPGLSPRSPVRRRQRAVSRRSRCAIARPGGCGHSAPGISFRDPTWATPPCGCRTAPRLGDTRRSRCRTSPSSSSRLNGTTSPANTQRLPSAPHGLQVRRRARYRLTITIPMRSPSKFHDDPGNLLCRNVLP